MQYKAYIRFKDGYVFEGEIFDEKSVPGDGKFLDLIVSGREENRDITLNPPDGPEMKRKYRDISSVDILFL